MREFKFKAWNGLTMYDPDYIDSIGGCYTSYSRWDSESVEKDKDGILLQWTGLKDKNDKDIYEGDICRCYGGESDQGVFEYDDKCIVKWQSSGFDLVSIKRGCGYGWGFVDCFENIDVIGNIYKNPELLKSL